MTSNIIRGLLRAAPFRPFTVHVADEKSLAIEHPENAAITQGGRMFFVKTEDEDWEWVDVLLMKRVETTSPQQTI